MTCRVSMPGLEHFQRDLAPHRLLLLGHEHHAHAPFADLLQQLVRADLGAGAFGNGAEDFGRGHCGTLTPGPSPRGRGENGGSERGMIEDAAGGSVGGEELFDASPHCRVAVAGFVEQGHAPRRVGDFQGLDE